MSVDLFFYLHFFIRFIYLVCGGWEGAEQVFMYRGAHTEVKGQLVGFSHLLPCGS